ncbi:MAG: 5'/3'-nucleotidase SurE [Bacteroidaceae bacterium]|nr:5'/3'-nucleotidase SurE [Bacteroidaceae bacterium]
MYNNSPYHPLILITNDDGYDAPGIKDLTRAVAALGEVWVVAPDGPRSGTACSITSIKPVTIREITSATDVSSSQSTQRDSNACPPPRIYACSGTPVDCVKLAFERVVPRCPDLVISGINAGDNASISVHYSGTMGAVIEGCLKDVPSIGFSMWMPKGSRYEDMPVSADTLDAFAQLCRQIIDRGLPQGICLNVNCPANKPFSGFRLCRQARGSWNTEWQDIPGRSDAFSLIGTFTDLEPDANDTDFAALRYGFCPIVPITVDMTAHYAMEQISNILS